MPARVTETFTVAAVGFNPEIFELDRNIAGAGVMIEEATSMWAPASTVTDESADNPRSLQVPRRRTEAEPAPRACW
jgi:hypothetical protein